VRHLSVIGIGAGDPGFLTLEAIAAIEQVDVFIRFAKAADHDEPAALRALIIERFAVTRPHREVEITDPVRRADLPYPAAVSEWHAARAALLESALTSEVGEGETAGILVWGDPALYDSTLRLVDAVIARGSVDFEHVVVPGISSVQVLAARHRIPLNRVGQPVLVTTGRRLAAGLPHGVEDVVVMLDGGTAFTTLVGAGYEIFWGAYLGTPDEILIAGPLDDVADTIISERAAARERLGWMFDTYLLRAAPGAPARADP
jgi:precorrin-6A synthase